MTDATDLATINAAVASLDPADFPRVVAVLERIADAKRWLAELQREAEAVGVKALQEHGAQVVGEVKYWAGVDRDTKCRDLRATAEAVMEASGGDWDRFVSCLSANAFKPGACRSLFDEACVPKFLDCFEVIEKPVMKDGKATKSIQKMPVAMLK